MATDANARPKPSAENGQDEAFCKQLADKALPSSAQGLANSEFTSTRGRAGKKQIGDIGAGDEQNKSYYRHQNLERF